MKLYLVAGESYKLVDKEVLKITSSFENVIKYDLRNSTIEEVVSEAGYVSLLGDEKCLVVKADSLFKPSKKDGDEDPKKSSALDSYIKNPNDNCTIIFVLSCLPDKRKKLFKLINDDKKAIIIPTLNKKDLTYKCMDILKENGYIASYEIASYILENSYNNYDIMLSEIDKIKILVNEKTLTFENLKNVVSLSYNANIYGFTNAILHGNLKDATKECENFEKLKIDPIVVMVTLAKEFEMLYLINTQKNLREVQTLFKKEDWQMQNYMKNKDLFTVNELKKIIVKLHDYDYKIKSGKIDKDLVLTILALDLCS